MLEKSKDLDAQESGNKKCLVNKTKSPLGAEKKGDQGSEDGSDHFLLRLPPRIQSNIDQILNTIEVRPINLNDLSSLGYRILKHVTEITESIKAEPTSEDQLRSSKK